jgi:hypothetical protein
MEIQMNKTKGIRIRLDEEEKELLEKKSKEFGFAGVSEYLRFIGRNCKHINIEVDNGNKK